MGNYNSTNRSHYLLMKQNYSKIKETKFPTNYIEEIHRIRSALKINPIDILNLKTTFRNEDIGRAFRRCSVYVHPDHVPSQWKQQAQSAFQKLISANLKMKDEKFCTR